MNQPQSNWVVALIGLAIVIVTLNVVLWGIWGMTEAWTRIF